jgi:hypothetical protein
MFSNLELRQHLSSSSTVKSQSVIISEWNMNLLDNIVAIGNYRYRKNTAGKYSSIPNVFDANDSGNYYTDATYSDITVDGGLDDTDDTPVFFVSKKQKEGLLYSLEDCFGRVRPRSGINKARVGITKYLHHSNIDMFNRPRYYMADKTDKFKYWTSFRTESGKEYGIANKTINGKHYIDDAAPFVVYKEQVPVNRVVVKMQTSVGNVNLGPFSTPSGQMDDPFFGYQNQTTPTRWKIQSLDNKNNWVDLIKFDETSKRRDGSEVIGPDGYVEISYGLVVPNQFKDTFVFNGEVTSELILPTDSHDGHAYLVKTNSSEIGTMYIWSSDRYLKFKPVYNWQLEDYATSPATPFVTSTTVHDSFSEPTTGKSKFREFTFISGLRVVVDTMNKSESTFDLIELSPRLAVDMSGKTQNFSVKKPASDLGITGLPVGQLLAGTGSLTLFDYDQSFNVNNAYDATSNPNGSIVAKYTARNIQTKIYEVICDVFGKDVFVPIKTMYSDGFPTINNTDRTVSINLRDLYYYLESTTAPELLIQDVSLSYAVSILLDSIGFSNYVFKRVEGESDPIIPFFFVSPKQSVAQVLQSLAVSTQTAMFLNEENTFVLMSKQYLMPSETDRDVDMTLFGSQDTETYDYDGDDRYSVIKNKRAVGKTIANIIDIASQDNNIYNDGKISYTTRSIQKSYGSLKQAYLLDENKTWIYKPAVLWEVSGSGNTKSINEEVGNQGKYNLAAIPLNTTLSDSLPEVVNGVVVNNIIDLGEAVYWMPRYNGYFYANGEIIKYDAVEYNVASIGNVWITSIQDYQKYFSKISFNGKIYPTGRVRIYSEPNYETLNGVTTLKLGAVAKHGRAQFGTTITTHNAGIANNWTSSDYVGGVDMESKYLVNPALTVPSTTPGAAGVSKSKATEAARSGIIKNFLSESYSQESDILEDAEKDGRTVQSSALVITGPQFKTDESPQDFVSYVYKPLAPTIVISAVSKTETTVTYTTSTIHGIRVGEKVSITGVNPTAYNLSNQAVTAVTATTFTVSKTITPAYVSGGMAKVTSAGISYKHFGTRMRVVGKIENDKNKVQTAAGATPMYTIVPATADAPITISGGGGGVAVLLNPSTNEGYYFEITALSEANMEQYDKAENVKNIMFYKIQKNASSNKAVPLFLNQAGTKDPWVGGLTQILVDDGRFTGQSRVVSTEKNTVYDISVEYQDIGSIRRFFLYINNNQVATLDDLSPLPVYNNMALFVRGGSKCMFENIYALAGNYSNNSNYALEPVTSSAFGDPSLSANESFRKYAVSGMIQSTYLSGVSATEPPKHNLYYEEFGTIMREASYFNVKYDKAYPALYAKIAPTFNSIRGYTVSGFHGGSYGAEFLVFNATDSSLNLDETSGNYLRILGITFTQASQNDYTVDDYFSKKSDFSNPEISTGVVAESPLKVKKDFYDVKNSRSMYGRNEFSLDATYIQSRDSATEMMSWIISKVMKPRKSIGVKIFANPTIQLGDLVKIDYVKDGVSQLSNPDTRFVVYNIEYSKSSNGPEMTVYLSEVV